MKLRKDVINLLATLFSWIHCMFYNMQWATIYISDCRLGDNDQCRPYTFWATVCKMVRLMLWDRCPVCLSCLWRWCIAAKRLANLAGSRWWHGGGLGPGDSVRWGPSSHPNPPKRGTARIFRPMSIVTKRLDGSRCHYATWYEGRPRPRPHCVRWGSGKGHSTLNFRPMSIVAEH